METFELEYDPQPAPPCPFRAVWAAALNLYVEDVRAASRALTWASSPVSDGGQAYRDYRAPSSPILHRLCDQLGYDADVVKAGIKRELVGMHVGGVQ